MDISSIANYIQNKLLELGFIVHRYNAYSTDSIYLKLDYGACNSIRISDHKGYEHLSYKYEVNKMFTKNRWVKDNKEFWRFHCKIDKNSIDNLIGRIISDKMYKKSFYNYDKLVETYKQESLEKIGFWEKAKEVKLNNEHTTIAETND